MVTIGHDTKAVADKGADMIAKTLKQKTSEHIPCGEELASVISDETPAIAEFCSYAFDTPDILLEKELQWPVDPDLVY